MNKYCFGRKFRRFRNLCAAVVAIMVYGFYYIYDWIYSAAGRWNPGVMAAVFVLIGVVFEGFLLFCMKKFENSTFYRLTKNALEFSSMGRSVFYPYSDFVKAYHRFGGPFDTVPVVFELRDKRSMEINQYIDDISGLTTGLLKEISKYAVLEEGIFDFAAANAKRK